MAWIFPKMHADDRAYAKRASKVEASYLTRGLVDSMADENDALVSAPRFFVRMEITYHAFNDPDKGMATITEVFTFEPKSVTIQKNTIRKADTARVTLNFGDFPLDVRHIYAAEIWIYGHPVWRGDPRKLVASSNLRFSGFVDKPSISLKDKGSNLYTLPCTDYTAIFTKSKPQKSARITVNYPPQKKKTGKGKDDWIYVKRKPKVTDVVPSIILDDMNLVDIVQALVLKTPGAEKLLVAYDDGSGGYNPSPEFAKAVHYALTDTYTQRAGVAKDSKGRTVYTPTPSDTWWDVISHICRVYGAIPEIDRDILLIRLPNQDMIPYRPAFILGYNVSDVKITRNTQATHKRPLEIRCYNPYTGKVVIGRSGKFPDVEKGGTSMPVVDGNGHYGSEKGIPTMEIAEDNAVVRMVTGNFSEEQLELMADHFRDEAYKYDLSGSFSSRECLITLGRSIGRDEFENPEDYAGRPIAVGGMYVNAFEVANGQTAVLLTGIAPLHVVDPQYTASSETKELSYARWRSGMDKGNQFSPELETFIYIQEATHDWSHTKGYTLKVKFLSVIGNPE